MPPWKKLVFVILGAAMLSGCGLRAWVDVEIADDSSGVVTLEVASDRELRDGIATFSPDADPVDQITSGLTERGWTIDPAEPDGEWEGVVASHTFEDLNELAGLLDEAVQGGGSRIEVSETADTYVLAAELGPPAGDGNQADLLSQAAEVIDLDGRLTVRFPGEVTQTNGAVSEDGTTVTWQYDEESIVGFSVEAEAEKPQSQIVRWLGVGAVVLMIGLAAFWVIQRGKAPSPSAP